MLKSHDGCNLQFNNPAKKGNYVCAHLCADSMDVKGEDKGGKLLTVSRLR